MTDTGLFQMDVGQQMILFYPFGRVGDYRQPLMISHSLSGPNNRTHLVTSVRETHELYGPGSAQYPLAFALHQAFQAGCPEIWAYSFGDRDLIKAIPLILEEATYPHCAQLKTVYDAMQMQNMQYIPLTEEQLAFQIGGQPAVDALYRLNNIPANQFKDPHIGLTKPTRNMNDYRHVGKSHNAKKRW